ncbi:MAG: DNA-3-methyladenine glycosylase [Parcubacteria group bacterium Gr01-1014_46]|nr:MAG: DNA-3-methyladenine glycosylase [Parcubacteria group bacterium Gr01-1014_46]
MQKGKNNDIEKALFHLKKDKDFAKLIKEFPVPVLRQSKKYFSALVRSIIYQQLSGKSAQSIERKFLSLFPRKIVKESLVLALKDEDFKKSGISPQKMKYLRDLALKFTDGTVNPKGFHKMTDVDITNHLVSVKGVGVWTTHMFLMFTLNRLDVLPTGDLGIQKGFKIVYKMKKLPDEKKMTKLAEAWKPFRTIACMYLWKVADRHK